VSLKCYRREPFEHTHENIAFFEFFHQLEELAARRDEPALLFGNAFVNGCEIDAILVLPHAIIVIDFKHYGGSVVFSENGDWTADGVRVKGGSKRNPFLQLRANKFALMDWLKRNADLDKTRKHDLGRISALVLFDQDIQFDRASLPPKVAPWFHVLDMGHCLERIEAIRSDRINLSPAEQDRIAARLGMDEFVPPGEHQRIGAAPKLSPAPLPARLVPVLGTLMGSLHGDKHSVHIVQGMLGTGLDVLMSACYEQLLGDGQSILGLAPNQRIASQCPIPAESLYSHLYDTARPTTDGDTIVYPVSRNSDPAGTIYVIADAHLVSSSLYEADLHRHGSGHILDDFLEFTKQGDGKRQVVLFGDPYQLGRGPANQCSLSADHLRRILGEEPSVCELQYVDEVAAQPARVRNALAIARQIRSGVFNELSLETDQGLVESHGLDADLARAIGEDPGRPKSITFSNRAASLLNREIRERMLGRSGGLKAGDVIHVHNLPIASAVDDSMNPVIVPNGAFAEVLHVYEDPEVIRQSLKGRQQPVEIALGKADIRLLDDPSGDATLFFFRDYLEAETPALERDVLIALRVHALGRRGEQARSERDSSTQNRVEILRSDPYLNAAQIRYGYAITLHRAQGRTYPSVFADLATEQTKHTEEYFRWVYTLLAISEGRLTITNAPVITPFTGADWDGSQAKLGTARNRNLISFDPGRERPQDLPAEVRDQPAPLVSLHFHVLDSVAQDGLKVNVEARHKFQEVYRFESDGGKRCVLSLSYNKRYEVTHIERRHATSDEFAARVEEMLTSDISVDTAFQGLILDELRMKSRAEGFHVSGIAHRPFREIYILNHPSGRLTLHLDYNAKGFITRVAPQEYTVADLVEKFRKAIGI